MVNMHTNGRLSTIIKDTGANFMYYKNNAITKNMFVKEETLGNNVVFTDKSTGNIWSATYSPYYREPDEYAVSYSLSSSDFRRKDGNVETISKILVSPKYDAEIRKYTLYNSSNEIEA